MKKIISVYLLVGIITTFCSVPLFAQEPPKKVFISQVVDHPALNQTVRGIIDGLAHNGYIRNKNIEIRVESAQANQALASQIAVKFVNQHPDVVVGLGTLCAQSFAQYAKQNKFKMVFSSVTSPLQAGLIESLQRPGNNTSGVSNFIALEPQLQLFKKIQPQLKNLGILYNAGELNSVSIVKQLEKCSKDFNITLIKQTVNKTADIPQAATQLATKVDAIFISNDNTALSALKSIIAIANKNKMPVYVSDTDAVALGALAALGPNQYQIGLQTAAIITRTLQGEPLNTIAVEFPQKMDMYLNEGAAALLGINIDNTVKKQATKLVQNTL